MRLVWMACGLTVGCAGGPATDEAASLCGSTPPSFDDFDVIDDGESASIGGGERRVVEVSTTATDPDGDLHEYFVEIYVDGFEDGQLPLRPNFEVAGEAGTDDSCVVTEARVGAYIPFGPGADLAFGETIEIGLIVYDAAGNASHETPPLRVETLPSE